jgi:hypothetical protein
VIVGVSLFGIGKVPGSIAGLAAACATGARAIAPVAAAAVCVAFNSYEPPLWLLVAGSAAAGLAARQANRRLTFAEQSR